MKLTSQLKLYIAIAGVVVVVAALVALLVVPKFSERSDLKTQMDDAEQQIQTNEALLKRRQETKQRAAVTDTELLRLSNQVPQSPELPALIIELQDAANSSGLFFFRIDPEDEIAAGADESNDDDASPKFWTVGLELEVIGTWQDTVDFLHRLRDLTRQIRIEALEVVPAAEESASSTETVQMPNRVSTKVQIEAYTIPGDTGAAPPAPAAP